MPSFCDGGRNTVGGGAIALMRRWTGSQLMMMLLWWVVRWSTHHPILVRSTTKWGCQSLLLAFMMSMDGVIDNDGVAH
jgi:hypothetical protein